MWLPGSWPAPRGASVGSVMLQQPPPAPLVLFCHLLFAAALASAGSCLGSIEQNNRGWGVQKPDSSVYGKE